MNEMALRRRTVVLLVTAFLSVMGDSLLPPSWRTTPTQASVAVSVEVLAEH
jgi:hypothetical protein